jgi:hypothetical protein
MRLLSPTQQDSPSAPAGAGSADDPLSTLHKMSTTAGLGSTDYVAVNATAIFAVIMGLASALTLFNVTALLVIPLIGIIGAIVALRQITRSNGTQAGRGLAVLALVLCVGFGGLVFARTLASHQQEVRDKKALNTQIDLLGKHIITGDYKAAYAMFDQRFQKRVAEADFVATMKGLRSNAVYGTLQSIDWKHLAEFMTDDTTGTRQAAVSLIIQYDKAGEVRQTAFFSDVDGQWLLGDIPSLFPASSNGAR